MFFLATCLSLFYLDAQPLAAQLLAMPPQTIKLGTHQSPDSLVGSLKKRTDVRMSDWAKEFVQSPEFTVAQKEVTVELVEVPLSELGIKHMMPYKKILRKAKRHGYRLCPPEVGLQLLLQYRGKWPSDFWIIGTKELVTLSNGQTGVLGVGNYGRLLVFDSGSEWYGPGSSIVFIDKRKRSVGNKKG